jgi:uncharacterized YigZ family protein
VRQTLAAPCSFEETIRKSRFLSHAAPVDSQAASLEFFESVADPNASHNCWAWRIDGVHRSSDDGEPGGSAGRPILSVLEGRELDRVMVVVTRWYGGINLGVGGLVRAYSGGAAKALDRGRIVPLHQRLRFGVKADFAFADALHRLLSAHGAEKVAEHFGCSGLELQVEVNESEFRPLYAALREASRGQVQVGRPSRL